jgi:predicted small secreted protein
MNPIPLRPLAILVLTASLALTGCGTIESAAQDDCTSIGWQIGSKGYNDCFKARVYERKLDYSLPPGDKPSPSVI